MKNREDIRVIRDGKNADACFIARILSEAFADDSVMNWVNPGSTEFSAYLFYTLARDLFLGCDEVYTTGEGSGAAMWLPQHLTMRSLPFFSTVKLGWRLLTRVGVRGVWRGSILSVYFDCHHPKLPHYYLFAIGVRPDQAGRGIGSALLREVVDRYEREGIPAYLENSNPRNLPLYERFGFKVIREEKLPMGGPPVWFMLREPSVGR